ncbi:MAG: Hsp20 family protein [Parvibaculum sp.]|nr:Hsp20 family protein [Parvibaculum sp.]
MTRMLQFNSPFLLGFDEMERLLERVAKGSDGYPPYNVEEALVGEGEAARRVLRITLAVAGFASGELAVTLEDNQLVIRGRQREDEARTFLHRGIAARQFQRAFVLADGIEVLSARLDNGLLAIDLVRPEPTKLVRKINIIDGAQTVSA